MNHMIPLPSPDDVFFDVIKVKTPSMLGGEMLVRIFRCKKKFVSEQDQEACSNPSLIILFHGFNDAPGWVEIAYKIAETCNKRVDVCIPDFHSHSKKVPAMFYNDITIEEVAPIITDGIMKNHFKVDKAYIGGFSWGATLAAQFAAKCPQYTEKLLLAAVPNMTWKQNIIREIGNRNIPVLLLWTMDDVFVPYFYNVGMWKKKIKSENFQVFTTTWGGHEVVDAYAEPIMRFLKI